MKTTENSTFSMQAQPRFFRRRLQDARIWNQIRTAQMENAAIGICRGFAYLTDGGRVPVSSWSEKVSASYNIHGAEVGEDKLLYMGRLRRDYLAWADACRDAGLCHRAAIDILFFGDSVGQVEKKYRRRHGWAMRNLMQSLEIYRK